MPEMAQVHRSVNWEGWPSTVGKRGGQCSGSRWVANGRGSIKWSIGLLGSGRMVSERSSRTDGVLVWTEGGGLCTACRSSGLKPRNQWKKGASGSASVRKVRHSPLTSCRNSIPRAKHRTCQQGCEKTANCECFSLIKRNNSEARTMATGPAQQPPRSKRGVD